MRQKKKFVFHTDGRALSNLGIDVSVFCAASVLSLVLSELFHIVFFAPAIMCCASICSVILTKSRTHGTLVAAIAAAVLLFMVADQTTLPRSFIYTLFLFLYGGIVALTGGQLNQIGEKLSDAEKRYKHEKLVNDINHRIMMSRANESLELLTLESLCEITGKPGIVYSKTSSGIQSVCMIPRWLIVYPSELKAAEKAFATGERCGIGTKHFSASSFLYFPITSNGQLNTVVALRFGVDNYPDEEMLTVIELIVSQCALAMTRQGLINEQHEIKMQAEKEKIRNDFLRAISHDLRTPLAGIISACSTLEENGTQLSAKAQGELVQDIHTEAEWLLRMVENLLSVTRVTGGANMLKKTLEPVDDIVWGAAERIHLRYPNSKVLVNTPEEVLLVEMDGTLIAQTLTNLMENAIKYSESNAPVEVCIKAEEHYAVFEVRDYGKGLDQETLDNLFTATTIRSHAGGNGLGIGLSICRTIVEAHGGTITGQNEESGGAIFRFTLPMEDNA